MSRRSVIALGLFSGIAACAGARLPHIELLDRAPVGNGEELARAAESFYGATSVRELRSAVEAAKTAAPASALYHELAAQLSYLDGDEDAYFDHLLGALVDPGDDAALLHLIAIDGIDATATQRDRRAGLLSALAERHLDPAVRASAAKRLAGRMLTAGRLDLQAGALAKTGWRPTWAIVGAFDNDQGKGFDAVLGPESGVDLAQRFEGSLIEVGWRSDPPLGGAFRNLELGFSMNPERWSIAYAASSVRSAKEGDFEVRIETSDPLKLWVNDVLCFEVKSTIRSHNFDQFVVPVRLRSGNNRILVKSAHETGSWSLLVRITGPEGAPAEGLSSDRADAPIASGPPPLEQKLTVEDAVHAHVARLGSPQGSLRSALLELEWARQAGAGQVALKLGDRLLEAHPGSIVPSYWHAMISWTNDQTGKTADLLQALDKVAGDALPFVRLQLARFQESKHLLKKARIALSSVRDAHPDMPEVWRALAELYRAEGWEEDECAAREKANALRPLRWGALVDLEECLDRHGFPERAMALLDEILRESPNHWAALRDAYKIASRREDASRAERIARRQIELGSDNPWPMYALADGLRKKGDRRSAEQVLLAAIPIAPDRPDPYRRLAQMAYEAGDKDRAVDLWKQSLARDPKDERLAYRLAYLSPSAETAWEEDAPEIEELERIVGRNAKHKPASGADVVYYVDDEVDHINVDGSLNSIITLAAHAVNDAGRDRLTRFPLLPGGRTRVLYAYAILPSGAKIDAENRDNAVRFRGLEKGANVILQYRHDSPPVAYLARHVSRSWAFQMGAAEVLRSRWVIHAPLETQFHESVRGDVKREEEKRPNEVRRVYLAEDTPPIIGEPHMPPELEISMGATISNVPSWDDFVRWEDALLDGAFVEGQEVRRVIDKELAGAADKREKLRRIHRYVMENVRYQQDYETMIAGVKPHPAAVVIERRYGDCKDKTVLFMTLAKAAGIETRFALVRTRPMGAVRRDVPMQQFNHAIVYVPAQEGLQKDMFFDSTADALDVETIRADDQGTTALVFDPVTKQHAWVEVPFGAPEQERTEVSFDLKLSSDGGARGAFDLSVRGNHGSWFRTTARNEKKFSQVFDAMLPLYFPGAITQGAIESETNDLDQPAHVRIPIEVPQLARKEGDSLRVKLSHDWTLERYFNLPSRKYPLVIATPFVTRVRLDLALPEGSRLSRVPEDGSWVGDCLALVRKVEKSAASHVRMTVDLASKCERISPSDYGKHRAQAEAIRQALDEELVIETPKSAAPAAAKTRASR
jgi:transglutaminase-like putative cysteine protease/tetratricopeptide (TPR) repeat protein